MSAQPAVEPVHPRPPRHLARLTRSLDAMHGAILVLFATLSVITGLQNADGWAEHLVIAVGEVLVAADIVRRGERLTQLVALAPVVLLAAASPAIGSGDVTAGFAMSAFTLSAVRLLRGLRFALVVVGAGAAYAAVHRFVDPDRLVLDSAEVFLLSVANTYAAGSFVAALKRGAAQTDLAESSADEEEVRAQARRARDHAVDGARQVLHDDVLTALRSIAQGSISQGSAGTDPARLSRTALDRVEEFVGTPERGLDPHEPDPDTDADADAEDPHDPSAPPYAALLARVAGRSPVETEAVYLLIGPARPLSEAEEAAVGRALLEALRNVARHTPCRSARLEVEVRGGKVRFRVSDAGPGIAAGTPEGFGLSRSVRHAMRAVGGSAVIDTSPAGTTVELTLAVRDHGAHRGAIERAYEQTVASVPDVRHLVAAICTPLVVAWLVLGPLNTVGAEHLWTELALLTAITALVLGAAWTVADGPPTALRLGVLGVGLVAALVVALAVMPDSGLLGLRSWTVGYVGAGLVVLGFAVPLRWAVGLSATLTAVLLTGVALRPEISDGLFPVGSVNALLTTPLISIVMGLLVRRNGRAVLRARRRALATAAGRSLQESIAQVASLHLDHTRRAILPWLEDVAGGRLDPADPAVREHARLLVLEARDDLHAAGFFDQDLRRQVSRYRRSGGTVDVRSGFDPGAHDRGPGRVLADLVDRLPAPHRITVGHDPHDASLARLVVVPPPDGIDLPARDGVQVSGDEFALVLEVEDGAR